MHPTSFQILPLVRICSDLKKVLSAAGAQVFMGLLLLGEIARLSGLTPHRQKLHDLLYPQPKIQESHQEDMWPV